MCVSVILLFFAYTGIVPTARSCSVSFTDPERITHSVEITASTLYEAAVLAMAEFRRCGFAEATFGLATKLTVKVRQPEMSHVVGLLVETVSHGVIEPVSVVWP